VAGFDANRGSADRRVKLLLDVNVSRRVGALLVRGTFDVAMVSEIMDPRSSDEAIIAEALTLSAVIITRDQDFSAILAVTGAGKPSLINLRLSYVEPRRIATVIADVIKTFSDDLEAGAIVTVDDNRVRIHRLPVAG
jgi:predicted nuclease of predicted toxin-antitoxin system